MPTKEEEVAKAEAEFRDRVFAKMLRGLPKPVYRCGAAKQHQPADFVLVEWQTEGTKADDDWWCDNCTLAIRIGTDALKGSPNGQAKCAKCDSPLVEAARRRPVVVKVRPCLRCGLTFWDKMEV